MAGEEKFRKEKLSKMLQAITPQELLEFQIQHYAQRLKEAKEIKERMFLRSELHRLKQTPNESM